MLINPVSFNHLTRNLRRIKLNSNIFHEGNFLSFLNGDHNEWMQDNLLANTRLIIEPQINGRLLFLLYKDGILARAICRNGNDITEEITLIPSIPKMLPIESKILIKGVLYDSNFSKRLSRKKKVGFERNKILKDNGLIFCSLIICNSDQNHLPQLFELNKLGFEIVETKFINYQSQVDYYIKLWREERIFQKYPTDGLILRVDSRKLTKFLSAYSDLLDWAIKIL